MVTRRTPSFARVAVCVALFASVAAVLTEAKPAAAAPGDIRTFAGGRGDGGSALNADFMRLEGAAVDPAGNVYVADADDHRVRRIDTAGIVTTFAGTDGFGFSGDGGPATSAKLWAPYGVGADSAGNVYIGDTSNCRIRKVSTTGTISTVAGNGVCGYGGDGGPATSASLWFPKGVSVDSTGNLFIADERNSRIRKVSTTGTISTVAGNGTGGFSGDGGSATSAQLNRPDGVVVDSAGNLIIADTLNHRVRKVSTGGVITTFAGTGAIGFGGDGGPATSAKIWFPRDIGLDAAGNTYIADGTNYRIRKVSPTGTITTAAGNGSFGFSGDGGPATSASMGLAHGVAVSPSGTIYIPDMDNDRVRKVSPAGIITTMAGTGPGCSAAGDGGQAASARLCYPEAVAMDGSGNSYIADTSNNRVRKISPAGVISTIAGTGTAGFSGDGGPATSAQLSAPYGVAADAAGNVYVSDTNNNRVRKISPTGVISTIAGDGSSGPAAPMSSPMGLAADAAGNVFIAEYGNHRIRKVDPAGLLTTVAGTGTSGFSGDGAPAVAAQLSWPQDVDVDSGGNLFIADYSNNRVRKVNAAGVITTVAGNGSASFSGDGGPATSAGLSGAVSVAVDGGSNVYIGTSGHRVRRVGATGTITTVAGSGTFGFADDGGPAVNAQFRYVSGVAVDAAGNLYIADTSNHRIRRVDGVPPSPPTATSKTVSASPASQTRSLGDAATVTAKVVDQENRPVAGVAVVFSRTGANPSAPSTAVTDSTGQARLTYTGTSPGVDVVQAAITGGTAPAVATVTWARVDERLGHLAFKGTAYLPVFPCDRDVIEGEPCTGGAFAGDWTGYVAGQKGSALFEAAWATTSGSAILAQFSYTEWQCVQGTETALGFAEGSGTASTTGGQVIGKWNVPGEASGRDIVGASLTFQFRWTRAANGAMITLDPVSLTLDVAGLGPQVVLDNPQQGGGVFAARSSSNAAVPTCDTPLRDVQGDIAGAIALVS